jgi:hypothetical protein
MLIVELFRDWKMESGGKWRAEYLNKKLLNNKEEVAYKNILTCALIIDLGKYLDKVKYKPYNTIKRL